MLKVKQLKNWHIMELSEKERQSYGFNFAVIHPDVVGTGNISPNDSDWECETLEEALEWVQNYDK